MVQLFSFKTTSTAAITIRILFRTPYWSLSSRATLRLQRKLSPSQMDLRWSSLKVRMTMIDSSRRFFCHASHSTPDNRWKTSSCRGQSSKRFRKARWVFKTFQTTSLLYFPTKINKDDQIRLATRQQIVAADARRTKASPRLIGHNKTIET